MSWYGWSWSGWQWNARDGWWCDDWGAWVDEGPQEARTRAAPAAAPAAVPARPGPQPRGSAAASSGAAPAAAAAAAAAVALPESEAVRTARAALAAGEPVTLEMFMAFDSWTSGYQQHNAALKWFRMECESHYPDNPQDAPPYVFSNVEAAQVAAINHGKGMGWDFDNQGARVPWNWLEMVAQMDAESMRTLVQGEGGHARGLTGCEFSPRPNSYDHKRHHALGAGGGTLKLPIWDFVLWRSDGTGIRLHPQWSTFKVEFFRVEGHEAMVQPPQQGLGKSAGRGTYKYYKNLAADGYFKFDRSKRPH